jgi:4-amino-4-deoxy-L-arabinose transferase-like glycosyltransferase
MNSKRLLIRSRPLQLLIIFLAALSLKLLIFLLATDPILFVKYPYFAEKLAQGKNIGERILDLSPLYLYINLIFDKIFGKGWEGLALIQIFLGSLNCLLVYLIGEKIFNRTVGFIAALLLILYGNLTLIELTLEPETFVLFFNSLALLALIHIRDRSSIDRPAWAWMLPGFLIGLSIITKPNALLLLPVAVIWIWLGNNPVIQKIRAACFLLLAAALVVSPVTIRNYLNFNDFILITADGGKVFFHGNGPGSTGMERADLPDQGFREEGQADPDFAHAFFRQVARKLSGRSLAPSECARFWTNYTLNYIRANPFPALYLEGKKFIYFWGNYEVHDIDSVYKNYRTIQAWPLLPYGILAVLGILGMILARHHLRRAFLLYAAVFVYLLSVLIFFAASRYRLPAVPFLTIFAAYGLLSMGNLVSKRETAKFLLGIAFCGGFWMAANLPFRHEVETFDRWQQATRIHYSLGGNFSFKRGLYRKAAEEYKEAVTLEPNFAPAYNGLGKSYALLNEREKAEEQFRKVIELSPGVDQGYMNLGLLYILKGQPQKALPLLEKALALNPQNKKVKEELYKLKQSSRDCILGHYP